jgi:ketosteroid isomerase-like protein
MAKRNTAALRTFASDDFVFDDRKRHSLVRGGVEEWLQAVDFYAKETAAVEELRTLATAGERLALQQVVWHETPGDPSFQIENLRITELDAAGKLRAMVLFDRDQRADANEELFERWAASAPANMPRAHIECVRGLNAHDLVRVRAGLCDDFVLEDHRRTGMGRVEGAENYVASVAAAHELSPDMRMDAVYSAAAERHGRLALVRVSGTNREGGAFESFYFVLTRYRDEKVAGFEFYEPEDLERALARFEELRPGANAR